MKIQLHTLAQIVQKELRNNIKLQEAFLKVNWNTLAGNDAKYSQIISFYNGILSLKVPNSMALQNMYMNKNKIRLKINEQLEQKGFQIIEIKCILEGKYE